MIALLAVACGGSGETTSTTNTSMPASADEFARFAATLEGLRQDLAIPGMSAAVVRNQELVWAEGFGYADVANGVPATPETPYHLASVTKPVAAVLIMQLVEEGALDLDDPVASYGVALPETVRVRHLLTHTSSGTPGTVFSYDGNRYGELSKVIEAVTGTTFRSAMYERILKPLDMTGTAGNVRGCGDEGGANDMLVAGRAVRDAMAKPYQLDLAYEPVASGYPTAYSAAAGLISSVVDLAAFDVALDRNALLGEETKGEMLTPVISTHGDSAEQMYAVGWFVQEYEGTRLVWHYGHWPPSISALYLKVPDLGLTFVALANTSNLSMPYPMGRGDVLASTLAVAFYREFVFPRMHDAALPEIDWKATETTLIEQLDEVTDGNARRFLERELSSYRMMYSSVGRADLVDRLAAVHAAVYPDGDGLSDYLVSAATTPPEPEVALEEAQLRRLIGTYVLKDSSRWPGDDEPPPGEVDVTLEGDGVIACADGQAPLDLVPVGETRFRAAPIGGQPIYVDVELDGDDVRSFTLSIMDSISLVYEPVAGGFRSVAPEAAGWSPVALAEAGELAGQLGSSAVLAARGRDVFFDWGATDVKLPVHSIRKPLMGAVFGIHVAAGDIDLDATLGELGIDDIPPELTSAEKQATVQHLLMARSGVYHEAAGEIQAMRDERPERGSHAPGTFYYYNNWDFNVLGVIFERETGVSVCEAFHTEIAEPIGMQDYAPEDCAYGFELDRSEHPAWAFTMTARDLARFGLLYLQGGRWGDEQVVPQAWIGESWTSHSTLDEEAGIDAGYLWRIVNSDGPTGESIGHHDVYWHTGLGVHVLAVVPDLDLVLIHRMDTTTTFTDPGDELFRLLTVIINGGS